MLKITQWKPDTCDCVIEYEWDDTTSEDDRTHTMREIHRCAAHGTIQKPEAFNAVVDENTRKNKIHGQIIENFPALVEEVKQKDGQVIKKLRSGVEYKWSFDNNRNLEVEVTGATALQQTAIQTLINQTHDNEKVKVK